MEVYEGVTVQEAITASGLQEGGYKVTVNGVGADLAVLVHEGNVVALVPKVEGGIVARLF